MPSEAKSAQVMTNADLDEAISRAANSTSFADLLADRGETTVVMDDEAALVVRHPEGRAERAEA